MLTRFLCSILLFTSTITLANHWDALFDHPKYQNAKVSPDGEHFAVSMQIEGKTGLVFVEREGMKTVGALNFGGKNEVGDFQWVNNERAVVNVVQRVPGKEEPQFYGELYAVNLDGSRGDMIYSYRNVNESKGTRIKKKEAIRGWAEVIDVLPEDKRHILISSTPMSHTGESISTVLKLNVYNGAVKSKVIKAPVPFAHYLTDTEGEIAAVVGVNRSNRNQLFIVKDGEWLEITNPKVGNSVYPLSISESGKYMYTLDSADKDLKGVYRLNLQDLTYKEIFTDRAVDITDIEMTSNGRSAYALRVDESYPSYLILNKKVEEAKVFKDLLKTFPYSEVNITSRSDDGKIYVVYVSSDVDPGKLYLYNLEENKLSHLFSYKKEFDNAKFAQTEPIKFKASDDVEINGLFTQAQSKNGAAPVVVLVHGGPHGIRDFWGFSSYVQYLTMNGYSVLQVNYRGSGGYGEQFEQSGYKRWGSRIQEDIKDGLEWLITQKKAVKGNSCIMGASFGGYSAVQSAIQYPELYRCAVANAGIYDLPLMFKEGDVRTRRSGKSYLKNVLGEDESVLAEMSPVNHVSKLEVPLLLAHGKEDERAPFEHVERLKEALDKANKPYQWYVMEKEGHGFYNPANQKAYMSKVLSFLDKHLDKA